jgi:hypothetical protein
VRLEVGKRSTRVQILQNQVDGMLNLQRDRSIMYGNQLGEGRRRLVQNAAEQAAATAEGFLLEQKR